MTSSRHSRIKAGPSGQTIKAWLISKVPWLGESDYIIYPTRPRFDNGDDFEKVG
jgi:hypothetical protein